jgi:hypothetical protein
MITPTAAYSSSVSALASVKVRDRKRVSGSIGFGARRSTRTSHTSETVPMASAVSTTGWRAPSGGHSSNPKTRPPRPRTARAAPRQSIRPVRDGSRLSCMNRNDNASTTSASGTFRKNTARQLACSTSQPPLTGPMAVVIALNPDHVPMARPRPAFVERGADDREAAGDQERRPHALQRATGDQDA